MTDSPTAPEARVVTDYTFSGRHEEHLLGSVRHRTDGPAFTLFSHTGRPASEQWWRHGKLHREDGPALVSYAPDGAVKSETFYIEGQRHRVGGPAMIDYAPDGSEGSRSHYRRDVGHRVDGYGTWWLHPEGDGSTGYYVLDGKAHFGIEKVWLTLSAWTGQRLVEEFEASDFAPFLAAGMTSREVLRVFRSGVSTIAGVLEVLAGAPVEWVRAWESTNAEEAEAR